VAEFVEINAAEHRKQLSCQKDTERLLADLAAGGDERSLDGANVVAVRSGQRIGKVSERQEMHIAQKPKAGLVDQHSESVARVAEKREVGQEPGVMEGDDGQDKDGGSDHQRAVDRGSGQPAADECKAGEEDQLPGERIEEPHAVAPRFGRKVDPAERGEKPGRHNGREDIRATQFLQGHDDGNHRQDDEIHRQNVEEIRNVGQREEADEVGACVAGQKRHEVQPLLIATIAAEPVVGQHHAGGDEHED